MATMFYPRQKDYIEKLNELADLATGGSLAADNISIADSGTYYTSTEVEGALQEVGASLATKAAATSIIAVGSSRNLSSSDNGKILECTSSGITLTMPNSGMPSGFACIVMPNGTTSVSSAGTSLLNGATTTLTRSATTNVMFAIQVRGSSSTSYLVTGV